MSQTEQALGHLTDVLSRVHDLALFGATGTTPDEARKAISAEVSQLKEEISGVLRPQLMDANFWKELCLCGASVPM